MTAPGYAVLHLTHFCHLIGRMVFPKAVTPFAPSRAWPRWRTETKAVRSSSHLWMMS